MTSAVLYGRSPKIDLGLSNGLHLVSMMTAEGDPGWILTNRSEGISSSIRVRAGRIEIEA